MTNLSKLLKLDFRGVGYIEEGENSEIAQKMALKLALSLAVIDGELHESEGLVIKNWLAKFVEDYEEGEVKERIKGEMNGQVSIVQLFRDKKIYYQEVSLIEDPT